MTRAAAADGAAAGSGLAGCHGAVASNKMTPGGADGVVGGVLSRSTILSWISIVGYTARNKFPGFGGF